MCGCRKALVPGVTPLGVRPAAAVRPAASRPAAAAVAPVVVAPVVIDTSVWGPPLWRALHIAANFSDRATVRSEWDVLFNYLQNSLPCPDCTGHYKAWYAAHRFVRGRNPPDIRKQAHEWLVALHNDVNVRTKKPTMTADEVATLFGGDRLVRIAEAEAAVASLQGIVGRRALHILSKILQIIKRR
jgi:hypothetical protein